METIRTIFFGDSFIACPGLPTSETWPALVEKNLVEQNLGGQFGARLELEFQIRSASQENTRGALERMQKDVQFAEPDIVVIQYGTNDSTHWLSNRGAPLVSQSAFRANLEEMIDRCRRFSIPRVVFLTSHKVALDRYDINGLTPDQNTAIYDDITRVVAARESCLVADVRDACGALDARTICQDDQIHVNQAGAKLYADVVTPVLKSTIDGLMTLKSAKIPEHAHD